jgi:hypothetical protein
VTLPKMPEVSDFLPTFRARLQFTIVHASLCSDLPKFTFKITIKRRNSCKFDFLPQSSMTLHLPFSSFFFLFAEKHTLNSRSGLSRFSSFCECLRINFWRLWPNRSVRGGPSESHGFGYNVALILDCFAMQTLLRRQIAFHISPFSSKSLLWLHCPSRSPSLSCFAALIGIWPRNQFEIPTDQLTRFALLSFPFNLFRFSLTRSSLLRSNSNCEFAIKRQLFSSFFCLFCLHFRRFCYFENCSMRNDRSK